MARARAEGLQWPWRGLQWPRGRIPWPEVHDTLHRRSSAPAGLWEKPFVPEKTRPQDFHVDESTTVKVPMMFQDRHHHWYLHDRYLPCSVLRMDCRGDAKAFFVLPDRGRVRQVEGALTPEMLARWDRLLQRR